MWTGLRWLRCLGLAICCVLLVLLVPSSAWSASGALPGTSLPLSLSGGSWLVSADDPTPLPESPSESAGSAGESESPGPSSGLSSETSPSPGSSDGSSGPGSPPGSGGGSSGGSPPSSPAGLDGCGSAASPCYVEVTPGFQVFLVLTLGLLVCMSTIAAVAKFGG